VHLLYLDESGTEATRKRRDRREYFRARRRAA